MENSFFFAGILSTSASVQGFACLRKLKVLCFWDAVVVVGHFWHIKLLSNGWSKH